MIQVKAFVFNPFMENTYILFDESRECVIIDPGCYEEYEEEQLNKFIETNELKVVDLINTHCHIDHVLGNDFVMSTYDTGLVIRENEIPVLKAVESYASNYGFNEYIPTSPTGFLSEGDIFSFGNSTFKILFLPGHAPGHIGLLNTEQNICIAGDVLFRESVGRTDLPGGDHATLIRSIQEKLFPLDDELIVYCGHGPETTIGHEKQYNPFCALV